MGCPAAYMYLFIPKPLVYVLTLLAFFRQFVYAAFSLFRLGDFLDPAAVACVHREGSASELRYELIRGEMLPVMRFSDLEVGDDADLPESCAVCLNEFGGEDEIRRLANCQHIFHRSCLDGWMDHDQKTCPMCRTQLLPEDMLEALGEKLWLEFGISDFQGEYSPIAAGW